ncbi:phage portal protein [Psychrobacillus psychrodurans]|uniref:phage tail assembly chaperone n=1 Tax=Psychrobacillus psychrodurans TaxID=126157 RepID=UPI001F4E44F9|nr:phage portal protein [Psychrobacillus psychrodurans]MCK1999378.1 phage portal protein [Psychrobacillus psychrodurans]
MSNLSAFLSQNAIKVENVKYAASKRFINEDGKPVEWEIASITSDEDELLRKTCTKRIPVPGKRNAFMPETDFNAYITKQAVKCTLFPNLNDVELQNSYGVMGGEALLKVMLTPGEYADYVAKVQEVNGFNVPLEDAVEEAKN